MAWLQQTSNVELMSTDHPGSGSRFFCRCQRLSGTNVFASLSTSKRPQLKVDGKPSCFRVIAAHAIATHVCYMRRATTWLMYNSTMRLFVQPRGPMRRLSVHKQGIFNGASWINQPSKDPCSLELARNEIQRQRSPLVARLILAFPHVFYSLEYRDSKGED
ncbi:hypothetical protein BKA80DRAFT_30407 [Phyllosticta citrichinensis]